MASRRGWGNAIVARMFEIAEAAGVSPAVVSRVSNGDPSLRIREETRERVLRTIQRYDYAPNTAAKSLRTAETGLLALVVHDLSNPLHAEIASGARREADRFKKSLLLGEAMEMGDGLGRIEELIAGGGVDGLILQGAGSEHDRALARAARRWMPTVLLQSGETRGNATLLRLEDETAGRMATECLLELGHRRIGCLSVARGLPFSDDRRRGWEAALRNVGVLPEKRWQMDAGSAFGTGAWAAAQLLRRAPEVTGLVVASVKAGVGALAALADLGRRVPEDISMVAIHDTELAKFIRPALTVVRMPLGALGAAAVTACCRGGDPETREIRVSDPEPEVLWRASAAQAPL